MLNFRGCPHDRNPYRHFGRLQGRRPDPRKICFLRTLRRGREISGRTRVNTGISTFVPKPFTPFQWARQIDREETHRRQQILWDRFRGKGGVKFGRHDPNETFIEGLSAVYDKRTLLRLYSFATDEPYSFLYYDALKDRFYCRFEYLVRIPGVDS